MNTSKYSLLAGRVLIRGFEGTDLPGDLQRVLRSGATGGLIVFRRNVDTVLELAELIEEARSMTPRDCPLSFGVDQEGGRVVRLLEPLTVLPPARAIGKLGDPALTEKLGCLVGQELRAVGITLNFAPVLDVDTNPDSPIIGDRSFGEKPDVVVRHGLAFARGLFDGGVIPCAKHFPGHGDATVDSHLGLPEVPHDRERLAKVELAPFRAWCSSGLGPIMTAHIVFPALDPVEPATTSCEIIENLLRREMGFTGTVLSDDLIMGAVADFGGPEQVAVKSIRAGVDGLLVCRDFEVQEAVREALVKEAFEDSEFGRRLELAVKRVENLTRVPASGQGRNWIASEEHERLKADLRSRIDRLGK